MRRPSCFLRVGGGRRVHAASRATNRTHRRIFAQHFWRTCRSFKVDGAEILNQVRRFSMPRASIAKTCRIPRASQALDRCSFEKNKRMRDKDDAGKFSEARCLHRWTDARDIPWQSHLVPRTGLPLGATSRSTCLWEISRSGRDPKAYGDQNCRETADR